MSFLSALFDYIARVLSDFFGPSHDHPLYEKPKHTGSSKMERFTIQARRVLGLAQEASEMMDHEGIGPEHLLVGLMQEQDGTASVVLHELSLILSDVEAKIVQLGRSGKRKHGVELQLTNETKKLLELSVDEARRLGHDMIGTEHFLLAMVRQEDTVAMAILEMSNITPAEVRTQVELAMQRGVLM